MPRPRAAPSPRQSGSTSAPDPGPGATPDRGRIASAPLNGGVAIYVTLRTVRLVSGLPAGAGPVAYATSHVAALTGLTHSAVSNLVARGGITPSIRTAAGSGHHHQWSAQDIVALRVYVLLDTHDGEQLPPWWPAARTLIQASPLEELAGKHLVCEGPSALLLDVDDTAYYLTHADHLVTVIGLDQCLTVLFTPQQAGA